MEQWVIGVIVVVGITLIIAQILYQSRKLQQARADFRLSVSGTQDVNYSILRQVRDYTLTWVCFKPNIYTLWASGHVLGELSLDGSGSLVGAKSAGGPWVVEGRGPFSSDFSLRPVQSQMDVVKWREGYRTIEFPTGRSFRYHPRITGFFRPKTKWMLRDDSSEPLISIEEDSKIVKIEQRAYSMPELPFLVLLGGYLVINEVDYAPADGDGE